MLNSENITSQETSWFVLKVRFNRITLAQKLLSELHVETFVPMEMKPLIVKGKKVQMKLQPMILNLVFVKSTVEKVKNICAVHKYIYYVSHKIESRSVPMVVPESQMDQFRVFVEGNYDKIDYIDSQKVDFKRGEKVRIISGPFKDKEAMFVRVEGKRSRQAVVQIDGLIVGMATDLVTKDMVEKLN